MANRIQLRRDTAANWTAVNPVLTQGEIGLELNTGKIKIGTGTTAWSSLPYFSLSYSDLSGLPTIPTTTSQLTNNSGFITAADLPANELPVNAQGYLYNNGTGTLSWDNTVGPTLTSQLTNDSGYITLADVPAPFSGDYADLTNTPTIPADISDLTDTQSLLGGGSNSYTPADLNNWIGSPTVNTVQAALDELAARVTALQNYELDGGNAFTQAIAEIEIDGNNGA